LFLAESVFKEDDTVLLESDIIFDSRLIKKLVKDEEPNLAVVAKYSSWMDGTVVNISSGKTISDFIEKSEFDYSKAESYYKTVNIYKFSKEFIANQYLPFLSAYMQAYGKNEYYETVLKAISHLSRAHIKAFVLTDEKWYEIDDMQDYDIASAMFSTGKEKLSLMQSKYGGYWRYDELTDFCYLVNPYFPPPIYLDKMVYEYKNLLTQYPSGLSIENMNAGRMFSIDGAKILVGNGAAELINSLKVIVKGKLGVLVPTFNEYVRCFPDCEIVPLSTAKSGYSFDLDAILKHVSKVDSLVLINPDNPSGAFLNKADMLKVIAECKTQGKKIIVDESFIDFADKERRYTLLNDKLLEEFDNLIVIKSISKSYGVPGLRLGILATSDKSVLTQVRKALPVWNINSFAEYFLQTITLFLKDYVKACDKVAAERARFASELKKLGFKVYPSQANFLLAETKTDSTALAAKLLEKYNILIKDLFGKDTFEKAGFIRLAVRNEADNNKLLKALTELKG